jgi:Protein of unknown function (DUF2185)
LSCDRLRSSKRIWRVDSEACLPPRSSDGEEIYDLNTIANYDPDIIPFIESPVGAAFERDQASGQFLAVEFFPDDPDFRFTRYVF